MVDEVLSICNFLQYHKEWLLDYSASHHMCPHKSWFSSYQVVDVGIVLMGNNVSCKIIGVGIINIVGTRVDPRFRSNSAPTSPNY
jgi:hypothetical protein